MEFLSQVLVFQSSQSENVSHLVKNKECTRKMCHFNNGPPPPQSTMVDADISHVIKWTRPSPSVFAYYMRSKPGQWEGLGTSLKIVTHVCYYRKR